MGKSKHPFLDLRTLTFALTNESHSLASACKLFGVEHGKLEAAEYGKVTDEFIDYCRRDTLAPWELYLKLREEFRRHPIPKKMTDLYSPASMGKGYLQAMGIQSFLKKQPDFPREILGYAMASFYAGRTELHIRKQIVPVTYLDVRSMYPTVFVLQKLWSWVIADAIEVVEATEEFRDFLEKLTPETLYNPEVWPMIPALVQIIPERDVLPVRAKEDGGIWQIGHNDLTYGGPLWYAAGDVIASKLLTGKSPQIVRVFRFVPKGQQAGLKPVRLMNEILVNPMLKDFFKKIIEERYFIQQLAKKTSNPEEKARLNSLATFLKILANSTSYGIFAEFIREDERKPFNVKMYGQFQREKQMKSFERPGPFCNPLIATMVTSAARLVLAMMERFLRDNNATYAFCDTDSMAVVGEDPAIADQLVKKFESLNPYDFGDGVKQSILKIEDENFSLQDPTKREPLFAYGISSKRYCLFNKKAGYPIIRKFSEHGLGHLINPLVKKQENAFDLSDELEEDKSEVVLPAEGKLWIQQIWELLVKQAMGLQCKTPDWFQQPAIGKLVISQPFLLKPLLKRKKSRKEETPYSQQQHPFDFMLVGFPLPGHAISEEDPDRLIRPVAPYESDPKKWSGLPWVDLYEGKRVYPDFSGEPTYSSYSIPMKTFGHIVAKYATHPETKAADSKGKPCGKKTVGELHRLHIKPKFIKHISKETTMLHVVQVLGNAKEFVFEFESDWEALLLEVKQILKWVTKSRFAKAAKLSRMALDKLLKGAIPTKSTFRRIVRAVEVFSDAEGKEI